MKNSSQAVTDAPRLEIRARLNDVQAEILSPEAQTFLAGLAREFSPRVQAVLAARKAFQAELDGGKALDFLPETAEVRAGEWKVAEIPAALRKRHVEITGPVDRKMIINALNSGADMFMADFEDSSSPTFANMIDGQVNLRDAVRGTISFRDEARGKDYALASTTATLLVRARGWHLLEKHILVDGQPVPGGLVDFGLFFFHNAKAQLESGKGPYFYLPKLQHHLEARLWNDVFNYAQDALGVPRGSIRATVLIETLPAAFQMDEILYELREHSGGLNCGRWDYIFSFIKTLRARPEAVLPDRAQVGMTQPFMRAYTQLVIKTCHRRGVHAMGGMAAQIPIKRDPEANDRALTKVRRDKEREVSDGHDGTWVAHPGLVPLAREIFADGVKGDNQVSRLREDVQVSAADLVAVPEGTRSEAGLRENVRVGIHYLEAWMSGNGCVPLYDLMEDAATAEISRAQVWQWLHHGVSLEDGRTVDATLVRSIIADEMKTIRGEVGDARFESGRYELARTLFEELSTADTMADFLTLPGYEQLIELEPAL